MGDLAVALHLPEPEASVPGPALHGLPHQDLDWAPRPGVDLIVHHVLEPLVVGGAEEDLGVELPAGVAAVHHLVTSGLVTVVIQQFGNLLNIDSVIEGSGISNLSLVGSNFALETLNQVTDGHTGGDGVGVLSYIVNS